MQSPNLFYCLTTSLLYSNFLAAQVNPVQYVNPLIGTGAHGHTFPGATTPFGMVQLSPDTRADDSWDGAGGYHYSDSIIYGFSHTHLSGTGVPDYCDFLLTPMSGTFSFDPKMYSSKFSHQKEKAAAGFYSVHLNDDNIDVELTATARVGFHKYIFRQSGRSNIVVDLTHRDKLKEGDIKIINNRTIYLYRRSESWARDQRLYAIILFSKPFADTTIQPNSKAAFVFEMKESESLLVKVALSAVGYDGAMKNMKTELDHWDFEKTKHAAAELWNKELKKIIVNDPDKEKLTVFYTALYHCFIQPNIYNDVDGRYRGRDMKVYSADGFNYYTVFSLWDTFRAWHPLMTLIDRKRTVDFIRTFLEQYKQAGLLPVWELSSNETECMIGYHAVSAIADAMMKDITGFDYELAYEAMKKSAESAKRYGLGAYMEKGFLESDDEHESVSKTLEYAYDDWCIAQVALKLNKKDDYARYMKRSQGWKNLFDSETGFIRARKNGGWYEPFDPHEVNNNFTEANAWQYTFFVPQDVHGLIEASGGAAAFEKKLDALFNTSSETTGREQSDITGLIGQYAHGNEPSHHMAYLYNYIGKPWKTQQRVMQIMNDFYKNAPDGLIGNEDCGQMSAWYVLSSMGLYPVCPGKPVFDLGVPLFDSVKVTLDNGRSFHVYSKSGSIKNKFELNEDAGNVPIIEFRHVMNGAANNRPYSELIFSSDKDETKALAPPAEKNSEKAIIPSPIISAKKNTFKETLEVTLKFSDDVEVFYSISKAGRASKEKLYTKPFIIDTTCTVLAHAVNERYEKSSISKALFFKVPHPLRTVKLNAAYSPQYTAGDDEGIIDGIRGETNWRKGNWQGYEGKHFECVIDLGKETSITKLAAGFLQDTRAWILFPVKVEFEISSDGSNYKNVLTVANTISAEDYKVQVNDFSGNINPQQARYVKVKAVNMGKLPPWHDGHEYDGEAWIFVDEVLIE